MVLANYGKSKKRTLERIFGNRSGLSVSSRYRLDKQPQPRNTMRAHSRFKLGLKTLFPSCNKAMLVSLLCFGLSNPLWGQELEISCVSVPAGSCQDSIQADGELQSRSLKVSVTRKGRTASGVLVRFHATSGKVLPDSVVTDVNGVVNASWTRAKDSSLAAITIAAISSGGSATYIVPLVPRSAASKAQLVLENWTHTRSWFEKYQLPNRIPIAIKRVVGNARVHIKDQKTCEAQKVVFLGNSRVGTANPDTIVGELFFIDQKGRKKSSDDIKSMALQSSTNLSAKDTACFVFTNWTLGENPGAKELRARIIPKGYEAPYTLNIKGNARALPRIVGGVAMSHTKGYLGFKKGSATVYHVERPMPDGSKQTYDSTVTAPNSVDSVHSKNTASAIAGVSIALPLWWLGNFDRLSFTGGIDLRSATDDFYAGGSLARLFGSAVEALPIDVHLLMHIGRQDLLKDPVACAASGSCATRKKTRIHGAALMLSADATTLISEVIKRLAP
jgi:hypothetical protein